MCFTYLTQADSWEVYCSREKSLEERRTYWLGTNTTKAKSQIPTEMSKSGVNSSPQRATAAKEMKTPVGVAGLTASGR